MARDPRYDILFEPVKIGPVTAPNRFYQVPHCNGTSDWSTDAVARMRSIKAEGGWGVVCTEVAEVHPSSEFHPFPSLHLWDDSDIPIQATIADAIHEHGALAGIELGYIGLAAGNRFSRYLPMGPSSHPTIESIEPVQAAAMDRQDIRDVRGWHRAGAVRAMKAGFDIVYVYCGHNLALPYHFLSRRYNQRTDEYGGSLENRARLLCELIEDAKDTVGHKCAVAVRFAVDDCGGPTGITKDGDGRAVVELLAELPDLWDVNISEWVNDSAPSRFSKEGFQEPYIDFVKKVTTKPVVGVGRFTSPDAMVSQLKRGIMDLIGAARPSIADPFLPKKIEEGRPEDIRECIGCNICISGEWSYSPIRCTQNPTMMEEWRRDWHPEHIAPKKSQDRVLIVGAGPAGLECALWLARRGCEVALADARDSLGGRVTQESALPGLAEWARVRDHRLYQLQQLGNASLYPGSALDAAQIREFGYERVVIATGATWRKDGLGRTHAAPVPGTDAKLVFSASDVLGGALPEGPVLVYDDDGSYLASALAERLVAAGQRVTYMTPATEIAPFTLLTMEQGRIRARLMELGVEIVTARLLASVTPGSVETASIYCDTAERRDFASVVMVTSRLLNDALYHALMDDEAGLSEAGIKSVTRIGDCRAPGTIAMAVYAGHKYARELDEPIPEGIPYKRGRVLG
ncbi:MAG: FAD-dependent oxidoreductase [Rhodospirillaceae bacterium]|nr:FAD-dependent oxidoreductase [Rhodospirillaceae bacterium]